MFPYEEGTAPTPFIFSPPALDPSLQGHGHKQRLRCAKLKSLNPWLNPAQHGLFLDLTPS